MTQEKKERLSYLGALALLFSYAESALPRFTPFFKLGLSNAVILAASGLDFSSFLLLCLVKSAAASLMSGTLFTPFFIVSIVQSLLSGSLVFFLRRMCGKSLSLFGISILASAFSSLAQVLLCSFYLGRGVWNFLGPMLIFSAFSGIFTAFLALRLGLEKTLQSQSTKKIGSSSIDYASSLSSAEKISSALKIILVVAFSVFVFSTSKLLFLFAALFLSAFLQKTSGRRILFLPHFLMWIFVFLSSVLVPNGKIIIKIWKISMTDGALLLALEKCLRLSSSLCLSRYASTISFPNGSVLSMTLSFFRKMSDRFETGESKEMKFFDRIRFALNEQFL